MKRATMQLHANRPQTLARGGSPQMRTRSVTGTIGYQAPEILDDSKSYGTAVDLWSLGIILHAMLCGYLPERIPPSMSVHEDEVWCFGDGSEEMYAPTDDPVNVAKITHKIAKLKAKVARAEQREDANDEAARDSQAEADDTAR